MSDPAPTEAAVVESFARWRERADAAQGRQVVQQPAHAEVARVVDRGLGAQRLALLVVLLDA